MVINERASAVRYLRRLANATLANIEQVSIECGMPEDHIHTGALTLLAAADDIENGEHVAEEN